MKNNYTQNIKKSILTLGLLLVGVINLQAQDITLSIENAQMTNENGTDYYEADVYISSTTDFYVGSGQIYLDYNTAAFGTNISSGNLEYTQPIGSIIGHSFGMFSPAYKDFIHNNNNNTTSRVSLSFQQNLALSALSTEASIEVTATPNFLFHFKIEYVNAAEAPNVCFKSDGVFQDQFITACGGASTADCTNSPGVQITNDTYDCSNAVLSTESHELNNSISLYPNPAKSTLNINTKQIIDTIEIYDLNGRKVISQNFTAQLNVAALSTGLYIVKLTADNKHAVKKLAIN